MTSSRYDGAVMSMRDGESAAMAMNETPKRVSARVVNTVMSL